MRGLDPARERAILRAMELTTPRLVLRDFEASDVSGPLPRGLREKDPPVQPFDYRDPQGLRDQIAVALEHAREEPRRTWDLAVVLRENGELIGRAGAQRSLTEPREALIWFVSDPTTWNQGYLTEGARALLGFCFRQLKLHRVWGECNPKNAGAVKVMETLGLRREGHLIENAWLDGWQDTAIYALLEREFS